MDFDVLMGKDVPQCHFADHLPTCIQAFQPSSGVVTHAQATQDISQCGACDAVVKLRCQRRKDDPINAITDLASHSQLACHPKSRFPFGEASSVLSPHTAMPRQRSFRPSKCKHRSRLPVSLKPRSCQGSVGSDHWSRDQPMR
jgi:hypothetical protein